MVQTKHDPRLTSSEIAQLWSGYIGDSMAECVLSYFLAKVQDPDTKEILKYALQLTREHQTWIRDLFNREDFPIPHGFGSNDVNPNAERLYSDTFMLTYMFNTAKQGLSLYAVALGSSAREDIRAYFSACLTSTRDLYNKVVDIMLSKGVFIRAPLIPYMDTVEYVKKEGFLTGILGDRRPLNSMEINHLYANIQTNSAGKALIYGFAQAAKDDDIRRYFLRGKEIAQKHIEVFSSYLQDEEIPSPMTWDAEVMNSTESPFSDKLMMYHISGLNAAGMINYGTAISSSLRRDLTSAYVRLLGEIGTYVDDGAEMMIHRGWLEKPPGTIDKKELVEHK